MTIIMDVQYKNKHKKQRVGGVTDSNQQNTIHRNNRLIILENQLNKECDKLLMI